MIRFILRTLLTPSESERERLDRSLQRVRVHLVEAVELAADVVEVELGDELRKLKGGQ